MFLFTLLQGKKTIVFLIASFCLIETTDLVAQISWTGSISSDWNTPGNWNNGSVPNSTSVITIPTSAVNYPVITGGVIAQVKSITIASGASLTMQNTGSLIIAPSGAITNSGTFDATASTTGSITFAGVGNVTGTITFNNVTVNGSVDFGANSTITGILLLNNGGVVSGATTHLITFTSTSTLIYNETVTVGNEWYQGGSNTTTCGAGVPQNVTLQSGTVTIPNSGGTNRALAGNVIINTGATLQFAAGSTRDLYIVGNWTNNGGTFTANGRKVTFNAIGMSASPVTQTISGNTTFYDLTFGNSFVTTDFGSSTINILNNFRNDGGSMNGNSSTINFTGTSGAILGGASKYFYNLTINNGDNVIDNVASTNPIHVYNAFTNNGTFSQLASHIFYFDKSGAAETFTGTGSTTFGSLTLGDGSGLSSLTKLNASANFTITGGSMTFFHSSIYNGNNNTTTFSTNAATLIGSGTANFYNAITNVSLNLGSGISSISNSLQINATGSIVTNAPVYGSNSTLIYNTTTSNLPTSIEWTNNTNSTGAGAPYSISVINTNSVAIAGDRTIPGNLTLSNGSLNINDHILTTNGVNTTTAGTLSGSANSGLIIGSNGSGTIHITPTSPYNQLKTLNVAGDLTLGGSAVNGDTLNIMPGNSSIGYGTVTVDGTLHTNGVLTLKSNSVGTARIAKSLGKILDSVTVERFIPARRAWRFLTAPFTNSNKTIRDAWQEGVNNYSLDYSQNQNPHPGYGTHITGDNISTKGFDLNTTTNSSIKVWDIITNTWNLNEPPTISTNIAAYPAYCVFVRGSRAVDLSQGTSAMPDSTVLRATGILNETGTGLAMQNYSVDTGNWIFAGNPYASSVTLTPSFFSHCSGIVSNQFWLWDPKISGLNGVGGYVTYSNGVLAPKGGSYTNNTTVLESGQGVMFKRDNSPTSASLTFMQADKLDSETNVFGRAKIPIYPAVYINLLNSKDTNNLLLTDGVAAAFGNKFSAAVDENDAQKNFNTDENIELIRDNNKLAIEFRPVPKLSDTLFLKIYLAQHPYALQIFSENLPGNLPVNAWIVDKYLDTKTELDLYDTTLYNFTPNTDTNSYRNRFMLIFNRQLITQSIPLAKRITKLVPAATTIANVSDKNTISIYPNPVNTNKTILQLNNMDKGDYEITIFNTKGHALSCYTIYNEGNHATYQVPLQSSWTNGAYNVKLVNKNSKKEMNLKLVISR